MKASDYSKLSDFSTTITNVNGKEIPKHLMLDPEAKSASPDKPPFVAPPAGSPPYYGFPLIHETCAEQWCFGAVTNFLEKDSDAGCTIGDGFVQAPDGSRAGLTWEVFDELRFSVMSKPDSSRWGVYYFTIPSPIKSVDDLVSAFKLMLPKLQELYSKNKVR